MKYQTLFFTFFLFIYFFFFFFKKLEKSYHFIVCCICQQTAFEILVLFVFEKKIFIFYAKPYFPAKIRKKYLHHNLFITLFLESIA